MFKKEDTRQQYIHNNTLAENLKSGSTFYWSHDSTIPIEITVTNDGIVHIVELENFEELSPLTPKEFISRYIHYRGRKITRSEARDYIKNRRFKLTKEQIALRNTDPDNAERRRAELIIYMQNENNFIST